MRTYLLTALCLSTLVGCETWKQIDDGGQWSGDQGCPASLDMKPAALPCPAAKGLTGDNLLCVDFANPQTTIAGLTAKGWSFDAVNVNCKGWMITDSLLQVKDFPSLKGICGFTTEMISMTQVQSYTHFTLSIQHRIQLFDPNQEARIFLDSSAPASQVMWLGTGNRDVRRQQTTITMDSADLPASLKSGFKWFFQLSTNTTSGLDGWQIESIALNGTKDQ